MPPLAEERCGGSKLQVLLGGSVCAKVDRRVDEAGRHRSAIDVSSATPEGEPQPFTGAADGCGS